MASFSSGMPSTVVYLVLPSRMALMAASLMLSGVSKSGSPAARPMTSRPWAFSSRAFASAARVADGLTRESEADWMDIGRLRLEDGARFRPVLLRCNPRDGKSCRARRISPLSPRHDPDLRNPALVRRRPCPDPDLEP